MTDMEVTVQRWIHSLDYALRDCGPDARLIYSDARRALTEGGEMSDAAARRFASWYHGGQASAGYTFASTGTIITEGDEGERTLLRDLFPWGEQSAEGPADKAVYNLLGTYVVRRLVNDEGPIIRRD